MIIVMQKKTCRFHLTLKDSGGRPPASSLQVSPRSRSKKSVIPLLLVSTRARKDAWTAAADCGWWLIKHSRCDQLGHSHCWSTRAITFIIQWTCHQPSFQGIYYSGNLLRLMSSCLSNCEQMRKTYLIYFYISYTFLLKKWKGYNKFLTKLLVSI